MSLKIDPFKIVVFVAGKSYSLKVEQPCLSPNKEIFAVPDGSISIQVQSNRPLLNSNPYNREKPEWKGINLRFEEASVLESIISAIQAHLYRFTTSTL